MYMLRAISAVLHQDIGPAVPDAALDLRPGELAVVVPLVLCLIGLSAYPNLISGHAFGGGSALIHRGTGTVMLASAICHSDAAGKAGMCQSTIDFTKATTLDIDRDSIFARHPVLKTYCIDKTSSSPKVCSSVVTFG